MTAPHTHSWRPNSRGNGEKCANCSEKHPCSNDCAHFDCVAAREVTRCFSCRKPIEGAKEACYGGMIVLKDLPFCTMVISRVNRPVAMHDKCAAEYTTNEKAKQGVLEKLANGEPT